MIPDLRPCFGGGRYASAGACILSISVKYSARPLFQGGAWRMGTWRLRGPRRIGRVKVRWPGLNDGASRALAPLPSTSAS